MKTYFAKAGEIKAACHLINAEGQILGRLATRVAGWLMGKGKTGYTPNVFCGDSVVVINAKSVRLTGNKAKTKVYKHYTGYPGGLREISFEKLLEKRPEDIIKEAVRRMLPKNRLGVKMLKRLRVYRGKEHLQQAQRPVEVKL
jgi:large subunit ribosomal protein L13